MNNTIQIPLDYAGWMEFEFVDEDDADFGDLTALDIEAALKSSVLDAADLFLWDTSVPTGTFEKVAAAFRIKITDWTGITAGQYVLDFIVGGDRSHMVVVEFVKGVA